MADIIPVESGTLEDEKDAGKGVGGVVRRWLMELQIATKEEEDWVKDGRSVYKRYRNEGNPAEGSTRFNILFSNVEILESAIYNSTPVPEVRRRFRDEDKVGKMVAEVLQRSLRIVIENGGFDDVMADTNKDHLLPGRGVARVRWSPEMEVRKEQIPANMEVNIDDEGVETFVQPEGSQMGEDGQPFFEGKDEDVKVFEEIEFEVVPWESFRHGPAKRWKDVPWIAFEHLYTKAELKEQFPTNHMNVKLDVVIRDIPDKDDGTPPDVFKRGRVWEIWDKEKREVIFMAPSYKEGLLHKEDDPLGLKKFFPTPKPLYSITTDTMIPLPEFNEYKDQADELDLISHRIQRIIGGMKLRGIYDSSMGEFDQIFSSDDNAMIPSRDGGVAIQNGGMERAVWFMPLDKFGSVLAQLYQDRVLLRDTIYETTGLSDILRGASRASETATAQNIKARFGGMRLDKRVRAVANYAKELLNIAAEIMAENFDPETLHAMTGIEITDEMQELMQDDFLRTYRVDIETDSTIAASEQNDQQEMTLLMTAIGGYLAAVVPMVQEGIFPMEAAKAMLLGIVRKFKFGREVEDAIEMIGTQQQKEQSGPSNEEKAQAAEEQKAQAEAQAEAQKAQAEAQIEQAKLQLEQTIAQAEQALDEQKVKFELEIEQSESNASIALEREKMERQIDLDREKMFLDAETKIEVARIMSAAQEKEPQEEFS
jgi:hypothetical protein